MNLRFYFALLSLCWMFSPFYVQSQTNPDKLIMLVSGVTAKEGVVSSVANYLEKKLGIQVIIRSVPVSKELKEIWLSGKADITSLTPYNYAYIQSTTSEQRIIPLAMPGDKAGNPMFYHSCIFVAKRTQAKTFQDVLKKASQMRLSFVKASSTSGHVFPRLHMASEGIAFPEDVFKEVKFSGGHDKSILAVAQGEAEIGAASLEHLQDMMKADVNIANNVQIIWESYPLPHASFFAHKNLPENLRSRITKALLDLHKEVPKDTFENIKKIWNVDGITQLVPSHPDFFKPIIQTTAKAGGIVNFLNYYEENLLKQQDELTEGTKLLDEQKKQMQAQKDVLDNQLVQIHTQQVLVYLFLALAVLALASGALAFRSYRIKKKAHRLLLEKNQQIQSQQEEILTQNEELQQQQEEILTQRDNIEHKNRSLVLQNKQIHSSIQAAKTIQHAILPYQDKLDRLLKDYFVIYQPKDIVSGDFFWLNEVEGKTMMAVADCTGHGIPGAFMTLIGNTLLDKIIRVRKILQPAQILTDLHEEVRVVLQQEESHNNYGMDLLVISMEKQDENHTKIIFSGAKTDLMYLPANEKKIQFLYGDRRSIGGEQNVKIAFTNQEIVLERGSLVYVGSDGLVDQNDVKRKRFGTHNLTRHLEQYAHLELHQQKSMLQKTLSLCMSGTVQRDDIMWMGFKV
jgi:phosphate/phosphite/phosphonate ABC transporter binding protein